jgi:murein DD-endopeptidase MepM/ murein hydrolase activator NlpD
MIKRQSRMPRFAPFPFALGILGAAAVFAARGQWPWARLTDIPTAVPIVVTDPFEVISDTLQQGESISTVFARQGITGLDFSAVARALRIDTRGLRAGLVFSVHRDATTDQATRVEVRPNDAQRLRFIRTSSGWESESVAIRWTTDTARVAAGIETSLCDALDREITEATLDRGERTRLCYELADVNAWSVDFSRDVQPGDRFAAVMERRVSEFGEVRFGRIIASDLEVGGKQLTAFRYATADGKDAFYDREGKALKRAFLAAPLEFRYVTSRVSSRRFHPVLGIYRRHDGTDYSAATGTPVRAAGNGTVVRAGWVGGYGRMVEVRHRDGITTRYAHLNSISPGLRAGSSLSQGDVLGKVGMTGTATAPHLHYEFRVNGVPRDPRSMKFEAGDPLGGADLATFARHRDLLIQLLERGSVVAPLLTD